MNRMFIAALLLAAVATANAQEVLVQRDNGKVKATLPAGYLVDSIEESVILKPDGPCQVLEVHVYYKGTTAKKDTLWIVGDPAEGTIPPTAWVWHYNTLTEPVIVDYPGTEGWYTFDLRGKSVKSDGWDRIVIQHRIKQGGPYFVYDSDPQPDPKASFIMDPTKDNSLGGPGKYSLVPGDYLIRLLVTYDFPSGQTSQPQPAPLFEDVTLASGLTSGGAPVGNTQASVADWNNDGWDDVAIGGNFFQNNGDGTFTNKTAQFGISAGGTAWGDFNNDGWIDVFAALSWGNDKLWKNNGDGTFTDVTAASTIVNTYPTMTPVWLDYNNDGLLDLFIANNRAEQNGQETYFPDQLWKNNGDGSFENATITAGVAAAEPSPYYDCYGASACDYNNDGWMDIFVANYRLAPDLLYRNNKNGTFTEVGRQTGVRGEPTAAAGYYGHGMGCNWGDFNNDGYIDLAVGNLGHPDWRGMYSNPSLIYENSGPPNYTFANMRQEMGLKFFEMNAGMLWTDLNNDGLLDLWHGQISYYAEGSSGEPRRRNHTYFNMGPPDFKLDDRTWDYGGELHGPWTAVRFDYDQDGDDDLLMASSHQGVHLFRNNLPGGNWAGFRLTGKPDTGINMNAYGTKVYVYAGGNMYFRDLPGGGDGSRTTQSSNELRFGLGNATTIDSVVVRYTNGYSRAFADVQINKRYTIPYEGGLIVSVDRPSAGPSSIALTALQLSESRLQFVYTGVQPLRDAFVELYNVLGVRVAAFPSRDIQPGINAVQLNAHLPSGVYLLRCSASGTVLTGKVAGR